MPAKLTHEKFMEKFYENNTHNITILGEYVNSDTKIHVRCNTHNIEYDVIPSLLLRNSGCMQCGKDNTINARKNTHEYFLNKLTERNKHFQNQELEIIGTYINNKTNIECKCLYCGHVWYPSPSSLLQGSGCPKCSNRVRFDWKKISEEEFIERMSKLNNKIIALDTYAGYDTEIRFMCSNNHIWYSKPHWILDGHGCPYCAGNKVWSGFNDLWTTRPDVAELLKNPKDGYEYSKGSSAYLDFICPDCGNLLKKQVLSVCKQGLSCSRCSDGVSYPNKFARAFLDQLNLDYHKCEYRPDWAKPYIYDNYFIHLGNQYILEMDGAFHYKERTKSDRTLKESQEIDERKTRLAIEHDICIIRIECLQSECNYIKNNMLQSKLNDIFDLSAIDWSLCDKNAQKNLVKETCNLYMNGLYNLNEIADILHIHNSTVRNYLKVGVKFGWCDYDPKQASKIACDKKSKPIAIVDNNENVIHIFDGLRSCERGIKDIYGITVYRKSIALACKTHKPYKGFNFRFANKTIQN